MKKLVRRIGKWLYWRSVSAYVWTYKFMLTHSSLNTRLDIMKSTYDKLIKDSNDGYLYANDILKRISPITDQWILINAFDLGSILLKSIK